MRSLEMKFSYLSVSETWISNFYSKLKAVQRGLGGLPHERLRQEAKS